MKKERLLELAKEALLKANQSNKSHGTDYWYEKGRESAFRDILNELYNEKAS